MLFTTPLTIAGANTLVAKTDALRQAMMKCRATPNPTVRVIPHGWKSAAVARFKPGHASANAVLESVTPTIAALGDRCLDGRAITATQVQTLFNCRLDDSANDHSVSGTVQLARDKPITLMATEATKREPLQRTQRCATLHRRSSRWSTQPGASEQNKQPRSANVSVSRCAEYRLPALRQPHPP
ncbi:hypothetical protein WI664_19125 [Vibrio cholerae]